MNVELEAGLKRLKNMAEADGYDSAIEAVRAEVHHMMSEEDDASRTVLWGVMGMLSRLQAAAKFRRVDRGNAK